MCGVVGLYDLTESDVSEQEMILFTDSLRHRGPDGRGIYRDRDVACWLGHRRLNILDLSSAATQPMSYANERYWIVFNGEIYNFLELRIELEKKGYFFRSNSDTETILAAFLEWGEACQFKFNGMWAFAIWDRQTKELFLSRDRFGVKPLYYTILKNRFYFASELKAFFFAPAARFEIDEEWVIRSLRFSARIEAEEETFLKEVYQLLPGHCLLFSKERGLKIKKWWETLDHIEPRSTTFEEQVDEFKMLFDDACRIRARSDVSIGTALSGGLDSSSIFCNLWKLSKNASVDKNRWTPHWQQAFSIIFSNSSQSEETHIQRLIQEFSAQSRTYFIDACRAIPLLDRICDDFEGVFDLSIGPWWLYKEYRDNNTVISIDGHGADELFGGYHHHVEWAIVESLKKGVFKRYQNLKEIYQALFPIGAPSKPQSLLWLLGKYVAQRAGSSNTFQRLRKVTHLMRGDIRSSASLEDWISLPLAHRREEKKVHEKFKKLSLLNQVLYEDFHRKTLPMILRNFDRCSMAHGVEIRAPFLDWRIVCFAFSIPSESKIGGGFTKRIIREAMKGIVPDSIRLRKDKIGFAGPIIEWMNGGLKSYILDTLNSSSFLSSQIWNGVKIKQYVEDCLVRNDFKNARRSWEFVVAHKLIESAKTKMRAI